MACFSVLSPPRSTSSCHRFRSLDVAPSLAFTLLHNRQTLWTSSIAAIGESHVLNPVSAHSLRIGPDLLISTEADCPEDLHSLCENGCKKKYKS